VCQHGCDILIWLGTYLGDVLTVEKPRVFIPHAGVGRLVPLVVRLPEDCTLWPDEGDGDFEIEIGFLACVGDDVGWA